MSKAVLVMDMPESCMGCNFMYCDAENNTDSCQAREIARPIDLEKEDKPDWCPLLDLPEKILEQKSGYEDIRTTMRRDGSNACIDAIGGGDSE